MTDISTDPFPRFPTARSYAALAAAAAGFVIYGSLLPFELHVRSIDSAWQTFQSSLLLRPSRVSRTDVLANILLFVPVGFALAGSLLVDRRASWRLIAVTPVVLAVSVSVSMTAEFLQTFALGRVPSSLDIAAQTVGCLVGLAAWASVGSALTGWVRESLVAPGTDRLGRVLAVYAAGWLFVNLAPFDITIDVSDLGDRVRAGKISIVPFGDTWTMEPRRVWDALAEALGAAPLGLLFLLGHQEGRRRTAGPAIALGVALVTLVEAAQVFIGSHAAHATDVVIATTGVVAGVWLGTRVRVASAGGAFDPASAVSWRGAAAFGIWCVVLCVYHWMPYDFAVDEDAIQRKLGRMSLIPFVSYGAGSYLNALNDLLLKTALSIPLGLCTALIVHRRTIARRLALAASVAVSGVVFSVVEAGQLFLPTRVPDPTDVLVGVAGTVIGLFAGRWVRDGQHPSTG